MNKVALGAQIRSARKDKELTSDKLAEAVGLTDTYLRQIESGTKTPSLYDLYGSQQYGLLIYSFFQSSIVSPPSVYNALSKAYA